MIKGFNEWINESESGALKTSRIKMKNIDRLDSLLRTGKVGQVKKYLQRVTSLIHDLEARYNTEQKSHDRASVISDLQYDLAHLREHRTQLNRIISAWENGAG